MEEGISFQRQELGGRGGSFTERVRRCNTSVLWLDYAEPTLKAGSQKLQHNCHFQYDMQEEIYT